MMNVRHFGKANRLAKQLASILRNRFGQDVRLHVCRKAIAAGLDLSHDGQIRNADYPREWQGSKAADRLVEGMPELDWSVAAAAVYILQGRMLTIAHDPTL